MYCLYPRIREKDDRQPAGDGEDLRGEDKKSD